jgi:hypothetical protein
MKRPTQDPVRGAGRFYDAQGRRIIQREILEYLYHHGIKKADALRPDSMSRGVDDNR